LAVEVSSGVAGGAGFQPARFFQMHLPRLNFLRFGQVGYLPHASPADAEGTPHATPPDTSHLTPLT
jgi:hypothetical protein